MVAVQQRRGVGDARYEAMYGPSVVAYVHAMMARLGKVHAQAVGLIEGKRELFCRNLETYVAKVADGRKAMIRDLVDVEGEFGLDVLVLAFGIIHDVAISIAEFRELNGHGEIDGL